ncbi:MAG: DMT family transporter [Limosilactobacillus sp.]|uniref:DMT family transporter n=1 Tax=Limosilactobacillus sp. TaxID=2773925 RepID=UPI0026FFB1D3|nr:DMT family transporter [Limosilactobacillus sp.]
MLLLVAILWGSSYVFAKLTIEAGMHSGLINACRGTMAVVAGIIIFFKDFKKMTWTDVKLGMVAGTINFLGYFLQTDALRFTTPAKNAFLTTLYVVIAPFIVWLIWREHPERKAYISIVLSLIGMAIITNVFADGLSLQYGDFITLVSAVFWAGQLIFFAKFAPQASSPWVLIIMIGFCQGLFGWIAALLFERPTFAHVHWVQALVPLAILSILITFLAQGLQLIGQAHTDTTTAGLILMLESFFASVMSVILQYDPLTPQLIIGGIILLLSNAIIQVDLRTLPFIKKQ